MKNYKLLSLIALTAAFSCSPNNEDGQSGNTPVEKYGYKILPLFLWIYGRDLLSLLRE